ncbi:MAG TPA: hypothetical protein PLR51_04100 [Methanomassiliicoccales archaeon]|nr:hypothetical protein [Methanomassiliicoccales archaeon]
MSRALVVGNGAAGYFSAWLLRKRGWEVILVGRGTPSTALSTGCLRSLPDICRAEISEFLDSEAMPPVTGRREGVSKIGTPFQCWMSPSHSTWEEGEGPKSIAVAGLEGHPSLHLHTASAILNGRGIKAEPFTIPGSVPPDAPPTSSFRNDEAWEVLAEGLKGTSSEVVLIPAMVHLRDYRRLDRLEVRSGRKVLEAISPLSAPGQRLADLMCSRAAEAGVTIWDGRKVTALDVQVDAMRGATVAGGMEARDIKVDAAIVATGSPVVDGLDLNERGICDPFSRFLVVRSNDPLRGGYDSSNNMLLTIDGRVMKNLAGAGDCLSSERRRYGSGLTESLESAYLAVRALEGL